MGATIMQSESNQTVRHVVRISLRGPAAEAFGWEICREVDSVELHRSTGVFPTRLEALFDSVRAAMELNAALTVEPFEFKYGTLEPETSKTG
jgi:hypothetical protein